jgi:tRNA(Ile)-lysidine synthetase-like protein
VIKVLGKIPKVEFGLACSGGVDSMSIIDFLIKGRYYPHVLYFNHNTEHGDDVESFITNYCKEMGLTLTIGRTDLSPKSNKEKIWSDLRYDFFSKFNFPIITCHHLDYCVETYIFSCLRGFQSVIPYSRGSNIIRPFLLNEKSIFEKWCRDKNVPFIQDESNFSLDYSRNRIRNKIVPEALQVNPGLKTVVKKMIKK